MNRFSYWSCADFCCWCSFVWCSQTKLLVWILNKSKCPVWKLESSATVVILNHLNLKLLHRGVVTSAVHCTPECLRGVSSYSNMWHIKLLSNQSCCVIALLFFFLKHFWHFFSLVIFNVPNDVWWPSTPVWLGFYFCWFLHSTLGGDSVCLANLKCCKPSQSQIIFRVRVILIQCNITDGLLLLLSGVRASRLARSTLFPPLFAVPSDSSTPPRIFTFSQVSLVVCKMNQLWSLISVIIGFLSLK